MKWLLVWLFCLVFGMIFSVFLTNGIQNHKNDMTSTGIQLLFLTNSEENKQKKKKLNRKWNVMRAVIALCTIVDLALIVGLIFATVKILGGF